MEQWRRKLQTPRVSQLTHVSNWGDYSKLPDAPTDTKTNTLIIQLLMLTFFAARLRQSQLGDVPFSLDSQKREALLSYVSLETASRIMILFVPQKILIRILKLLPLTSLTVDERTWAMSIVTSLSLEIAKELFD
jgi:hypothetical protein